MHHWIAFGEFYVDEFVAGRVGYETIARFAAQRSILVCTYSVLLRECEIIAIDYDPELYAELQSVANQYAASLNKSEKISYMKALYALTHLAEKRLDTKKTAEQ